MKRSAFLACAFAAASLPLAVMAQTAPTDWPTKPVTMVVPYPPGGLNDAVARVYADKMQAELGKAVLIDNRAGAATTVASNYVAKTAPDATRSMPAARR
jgi:tripartite-type tricarboxylate transporter receptor subunit TctC